MPEAIAIGVICGLGSCLILENERWGEKGKEMERRSRRVLRKRARIGKSSETTVRLHIEPLAEGGYLATSPDVPGLVAEGRSVTEAVEIAQGLTRRIVESCLEHGDPLPKKLAKLAEGPLNLVVPVGIR